MTYKSLIMILFIKFMLMMNNVPLLFSRGEQVILKNYDGSVEELLTISSTNGPNDYFAVRYSIPENITIPYKIVKVRFYNSDSQTNWPSVLITHALGNNPDIENPVTEFTNVTGPSEGYLEIATDINIAKSDDVFLVVQMPPNQSFSIPGGTGNGPAVGVDNSSYQSGNLYSTDGHSFSELGIFNLGFELIIEPNSTVPVELSAFSAFVKKNSIMLKWRTLTESNSFGFEIERSRDKISFLKIGFVKGNGTTTVVNKYEFIDKQTKTGTFYYRLKQIDIDGKFEYSPVVKVYIAAPSGFKLGLNYPNPFNPETIIPYEISTQGHVSINIYNLKGQKIRTLVNSKRSVGYYTIVWDGKDNLGRDVASGVYLYRLQSYDFSEYKKLTLIR